MGISRRTIAAAVLVVLLAGGFGASVFVFVLRPADIPESPPAIDQFFAMVSEAAIDGEPAAPEALSSFVAWVDAVALEVSAACDPPCDPSYVRSFDLADPAAPPNAAQAIRDVLARLRSEGLDARMAALASSALRPRELTVWPLFDYEIVPHLNDARQISRLNWGRMTEAVERQDWDLFATAFDDNLSFASRVGRVPIVVCYLTAVPMQGFGFDLFADAFASGQGTVMGDAVLARLDSSIARHQLRDIRWYIRGERFKALDSLRAVYEQGPDGFHWLESFARVPPPPRTFDPFVSLGWRYPSLRTQVRRFNDHSDEVERRAAIGLADRLQLAPMQPIRPPFNHIGPATEELIASQDIYLTRLVGYRTLIALERYRLQHDRYPESLSELIPDFIEDVTDPSTGAPLGYLPPSKGPYSGKSPFILYAGGADGKNDGGAVGEEPAAWTPSETWIKDYRISR